MGEHQLSVKEMAMTFRRMKRKDGDAFNTVYVADQRFLKPLWVVIDGKGKYHVVTYNKSAEHPQITGGWQAIGHYYGLQTHHQISFTHFGLSVLLITVYRTLSQPQAFPKWHSLYRLNPNSVVFRFFLTKHKVSCSTVDVPSSFYYFVRDAKFTHIYFDGINRCKIVVNHWRKTAKIEAGWRQFAKDKHLREGITFIMEFPDPTMNIALWYVY